MKRKIAISLILIIIMMMIVSSFQHSLADSDYTDSSFYCKNTELGVMAYKQISAFRLSLADGSTLADAVSTTETSVNIEENMNRVEVVFILDASGSMSGNRNSTTKSATIELTNALFEKVGANNLMIGAIFFSSNMGAVLELTNDQEKIKSHLSTLPASGGTRMNSSLVKAKEMLTKGGTDSNTIKIICTLSDGGLGDEGEAISTLKSIHDEGISTMSIFVETSITPAFSNLEAENGEHHKNFQTSTANLAQTIASDIYNAIYLKIILLADPVTTYNISNAGIIPGNSAIIQVDDEIIHGATLQVEYVFCVVASFDSNDIKITDFLGKNFVFNPNQQLLTENKTNNDYGWHYEGDDLVSKSPEETINGTEEYKVKLVVSTLITPQMLSNLGRFENYANFELKRTSSDEVIKIDSNTTNPEDPRIKALDVLILPPTGSYFSYILERTAWGMTMFVGIISLVLIIICIEDYAQSERNKTIKKVR